MSYWLTQSLVEEIRSVFEPKYQRELTNEEIVDIANNLTEVMELVIRNKVENGV